MRRNIYKLYKALDQWKWQYLSSGLLFIIAIFVRSLEPKILQIAVDNVVLYVQSAGEKGQFGEDFISRAFYAILPAMTLENFGWVLLCLGLAYIGLSVIRAVVVMGASALNVSSAENAVKRLRDTVFGHIQALPLSFYSELSHGELIQRCTGDIDTVRKFLINQVVEVIRLTAIFGFSLFMMLIVDWRLALISVSLVPFLAIGSFIFFKREGKVWQEHESEADKLNDIANENLNGIRIVKSFANEDWEMDRFERQNRAKLAMGIKHVKLHMLYWPISDTFVLLQITMSIMAGGYFALVGNITLGELLGFYTYIVMVAWPLRQVGRVLSQMGMATVAIGRIWEILEMNPEDYRGAKQQEPLRGAIEFRDISFSYNGDGIHALNDVSFRISPGERVAIIGPTGSGKSTIIKLLTRFYEPNEGKILIDGKNISGMAKEYLRRNIGVVLQKPFLFSTTVKDNISYGKPHTDEELVMDAAKVAQIHTLEEVLPNGFETVLGEKGVTLSGGQKQRVALARTVLSQPDVLVLDDITSAVDTETEQEIFKAMQEQMADKTTIIISHRLTSIQQADQIIVLDKGKIVQSGTHRELVNQPGYYREIYELQTALESEIKT